MNFINQKGFSIVQGLMLAGLLSGTALVTSRLVADQKKAAVSAESKDAVDDLERIIFNYLQHSEHCYATLQGNSAVSPLSGTKNITTIRAANYVNDISLNPNSQQVIFQTGKTYFENNISIKQMQLTYQSANSATLKVDVSRNVKSERTKNGFGGKDLSKEIKLVIKRNALNSFSGCYAVKKSNSDIGEGGTENIVKTFCEGLGEPFEWNETNKNCLLKAQHHQCPNGQYVIGISTTGIITKFKKIVYKDFAGVVVPTEWEFDDNNKNVDSVGNLFCQFPKSAIRISDFIDENTVVNCTNKTGVRFVKSGNKVRIGCN